MKKHLAGAAFLLSACFLPSAFFLSPSHPSAQKVELPDVLKAATAYVLQYSEKLQAITAEEEYLQLDVSGGRTRATRRFISDVVFVGAGHGQLVTYRDAYSVDANPLRERDGRLFKLLQEPGINQLGQALELTAGSTTHYVSRNMRLFDEVLEPLTVLRGEHHEQITFKLDGVKTIDGARIATVKFSEKNSGPRPINSPIDEPASGRLQIDVNTGAVIRTELAIANRHINLRAMVIYARDAATDLWLPKTMTMDGDITTPSAGSPVETRVGAYDVHEALQGTAKYSKYKQVPLGYKIR